MNTIKQITEVWEDKKETHRLIAEALYNKVNEVPELKAHRDFVENNQFGFGDRPHTYMYKLIVDEMPEVFCFMEIGIYRGATLSLFKLLANMVGKTIMRVGVSPMSTAGNFAEHNYEQDVIDIHNKFNLEKDYSIIKGLSTDSDVIALARMVYLDILFIDGGHDFKTVSSDLANYLPLIKKDGFLIIDDACNEMDLPEGYFGGIQSVTDAVLAFPLPNEEFKFLFSVSHNKVFQKIK